MSGRIPKEFVTEKTWDEYCDNVAGPTDFLGYLHANMHLVDWLDDKLATAKNFEELKTELLNLRNERQGFIDFAEKNLP